MKEFNIFWVLVITIFIYGCSNRQAPAPVIEAHGTTPLNQRLKNSVKGTEYIVKKGETLFSIAWRANLDVRTLAKINNLEEPYRIFPQQKLFLVKKISAKSKPNVNKSQIVKKPIAPPKNQAYRDNTVRRKTETVAQANKQSFSQKVRQWYWPAKGKIIKSFSSAQQGNKGIDIAGKRGDNIIAAANGKVVYAGDALQGYGRLIIIKHNDDYLSAYAHNDKILVKEQQQIKAGQLIAKMGSTDAERVMLHFEIRFRGKSVNPMKYLPR